MKPAIVRPDAVADIEDAFHWYESERPGLGITFRREVISTLMRIEEYPQSYPQVGKGARRALLQRFPYSVYFRELIDVIAVVACVHNHRDPRVWQSRL